jgi:hypothetical protein
MNDEILQDAGDETAETPNVSESNAEAEQLRAENQELRTQCECAMRVRH